MQQNQITIAHAQPSQAAVIAQLIMQAMTDECCLSFVGSGQTLDDFRQLMHTLVALPDTQYSFRNTWVALHRQTVVGCCVAYEGSRLHGLRQAFIDGARRAFGRDHSCMPDETQAGEFYVDSLAVPPAYQGRGIATQLLRAVQRKACALQLPVGLLVDTGNPAAERLYRRLGFRPVGEAAWGGHAMKHMQWCG